MTFIQVRTLRTSDAKSNLSTTIASALEADDTSVMFG
jgi:hypothetical protein